MLQFTAAGGMPSSQLLAGRHGELLLKAPAAGRRQYGEFSFRVGPAKEGLYINGTWLYHRPLPEGSNVGLARLVGRKHGHRWKFHLQFMVKQPEPVQVTFDRTAADPLVAIHLGWSADGSGRRIAGVSHGPDPGAATLVQMPPDIEQDLQYSRELASSRDQLRNKVVSTIKEIDATGLDEAIAEELATIRRLRPEHVTQRRLHALLRRANEADATAVVDALSTWAQIDRNLHIQADALGKRARNRRWNNYQEQALALVRGARMVAMSHLDLAAAAVKIDEETGERSDFTAAARRGRTDASISELVSAIKWVCNKSGTPLVLVEGEESVGGCGYCGGKTQDNPDDWQLLDCSGCGAQVERKHNAAARLYQLVEPHQSALAAEHEQQQAEAWHTSVTEQAERKAKMAEGRRTTRANREQAEEQPGAASEEIAAL